ncbi:MAG: class I SAM-dependent methyltransferase family protein [Candidatus Aenigmarchaeota archaeon]|nr:class I SAM-dependent methyltransferase family protein [Candidatus Aenigmarchaeota archaeon]
MRLRELLEKRFSEKDLKLVKGAFDVIGKSAIMEIPDELSHREKDIVEALLEMHPHIETVYKKGSDREGTFRLRDLKLIHGEEKEEEYKEHGYRVRLNVKRIYFSPREGTERQRIASMVKPKETVMVMFAGVGPYSVAIAKKQPKVAKVYSIELNPDGYKYMEENFRINKVSKKVVPILGDCETGCAPYFGKCDRVVMPLPKGAYEYLEVAVKCLKKKGGIIHYYFLSSPEALSDIKEIVKADIEFFGRKIKSMKEHKAALYSPSTQKYCLDIEVE